MIMTHYVLYAAGVVKFITVVSITNSIARFYMVNIVILLIMIIWINIWCLSHLQLMNFDKLLRIMVTTKVNHHLCLHIPIQLIGNRHMDMICV